MLRTLNLLRVRTAALPDDWSWLLKGLLVVLFGLQAARLVWALVQPVSPVGDWRPAMAQPMPAAARSALIASVNPFDRGATPAVAAATLPNDLKLFGVRDNVGGVGGGAIVGLPDGQQVSVSVGEEVMPGVRLVAVGFDFVEVDRGGARQRLFMDQDKPAETVGGAPASAAAPIAAPAAGSLSAASLRAAAQFTPRLQNGAVTGITVQAGADAQALAASGMQAGDVIVSVNGVRIQSAADAAQLQQSLVPGASLSLTVERGGAQVPLSLKISGTP